MLRVQLFSLICIYGTCKKREEATHLYPKKAIATWERAWFTFSVPCQTFHSQLWGVNPDLSQTSISSNQIQQLLLGSSVSARSPKPLSPLLVSKTINWWERKTRRWNLIKLLVKITSSFDIKGYKLIGSNRKLLFPTDKTPKLFAFVVMQAYPNVCWSLS